MKRLQRLLATLVVSIVGLTGISAALPEKPTQYVTDQAQVLDAGTIQDLDRQLDAVERQTSNQIVVAIYPRLPDGEELAQYATKTFQSWGVGQKGKDNGLVLFIFTLDHKLFIATGKGLEGAVPDAVCQKIISQEIAPKLKQNDYPGGVRAGVAALIAASQGEYQGTGATVADRDGQQGQLPGWVAVLVVLFFIFLVVRGRSALGTSYFLASGGGGWSTGGGGGGGSSGGFSGGGGGSAGGGAGGSW